MPHLLFQLDNRGTVLQQERSEGMTKIVQADPANASLGQHRKEYTMVEVIRVENHPSGDRKTSSSEMSFSPFQVSLQQSFVAKVKESLSELTGTSPPAATSF